jgi:hypothetical protein
MIKDLEVQTEYRKAVVLALAHAVKPNGFRFNYLLYVINEGFTAKEFYGMETFWRDVCRWHDSVAWKGLHPITRQSVIEKFDERIPTRAGKLEAILQADRADGENGVFHLLSRIVLDRDPSFTDVDDEEFLADDDPTNGAESKS